MYHTNKQKVLEWARKNWEKATDVEKKYWEFVFPELRESEDERIRKCIRLCLNECVHSDIIRDYERDECLAYLEKQKENPKSSDSIPADCTSDEKCEDRWHKVQDSLPDNGRLVLAQDNLGNRLLARYDGEGNWEVSVYDNEDYYCRNTITKWCEIPSEKQKEQKPSTPEDIAAAYQLGLEEGRKDKDIKILRWRDIDECHDIPDGHYVVVAYNSPGSFGLDVIYDGKLLHPTHGSLRAIGIFYIPNADELCGYKSVKEEEQKLLEWKPQPESLEALMYAIEGKWEKIRPTSYLSRRLEELYDGLINTFNVDESLLDELPKVAAKGDIEELRKLKRKIDASMEKIADDKQDYSGLNDLEGAIHRGFLCAGVENDPVTIIKETAKDCLAQMKPAEWSEEDEHRRKDAIYFLESAKRHYADTSEIEKTIAWLKSLSSNLKKKNEDVAKLCSNEWSEEDEENYAWFDKLFRAESVVVGGREIPQDKYLWFKSLRAQPREEVYLAAKHDMAIKFMNYLDENRPEGKMGLSIAECKDIDKAFRENDWAKIMRYIDKYQPHWKPSEEQMEAFYVYLYQPQYIDNSEDERLKLVESLYNDLKKL